MIRILFGIFIVLHGLVHMLYFGQSARYFELQPGMVWPDGAWTFSRLLGDAATRNLASALLVLAAIGFATGGIGVLAGQSWWRPAIIASTVFSSAIYIFFWDGVAQHLSNKGAIGILINAALLAAVLVFQWPDFDF